MRRGEHAHVDRDRLSLRARVAGCADPAARAKLRLGVEAYVADFVEENGAGVGLLEATDPPRVGAGKGAFLVPEEFALQQGLRNRRAVHRDERLLGAIAVLIDRPGDQFFPGAGLPADEHGHGRGGDAADLLVNFLHRAAIADDGVAAGDDVANLDRLEHEPARQ